LPETLPDGLMEKFRLLPRWTGSFKKFISRKIGVIHGCGHTPPGSLRDYSICQLRLLQLRTRRKEALRGFVFGKIGDFFNNFYHQKLPFDLTGAQKKSTEGNQK
jgi:ATP-dependent DNA helicase RecG